jgi:predicted MPP superfamily phosphohydrolase
MYTNISIKEKRELMIKVVLLIIVILIIIYIYFETWFPKAKVINIKPEKTLPKDGIKVVQISDYHNFKYNNRVLKLVKDLNPDIIFITGDIIDKRTKDYKNAYNFLENLALINSNIYYVPGNHELKSGNMEEILEGIKKRRTKVLMNENKTINIKGNSFNICGIDYSSSKRSNLGKTLKGIDSSKYTFLLCHKPDIVKDYSNISCDLILCGHTHGGQIRFPLIGSVIAPDQGILPKYDKGLYKINEDTLLYIDSGVGTTRLPIRFLNRSQISLIKIEKEDGLY